MQAWIKSLLDLRKTEAKIKGGSTPTSNEKSESGSRGSYPVPVEMYCYNLGVNASWVNNSSGLDECPYEKTVELQLILSYYQKPGPLATRCKKR
jgi:hypothetical protein